MARRKTASVKRTSDVVVVTPPPAAAPITRRRRSSGVRRRKTTRRRRSSSASGGSFKNKLIGTAMGGLGYGLIEKHFGTKIPQLPFIGRSGTVAIACYFFAGKHPLVKDVGIAAAAIAGYSFGATGKVSGDYDDEHGLAAEE